MSPKFVSPNLEPQTTDTIKLSEVSIMDKQKSDELLKLFLATREITDADFGQDRSPFITDDTKSELPYCCTIPSSEQKSNALMVIGNPTTDKANGQMYVTLLILDYAKDTQNQYEAKLHAAKIPVKLGSALVIGSDPKKIKANIHHSARLQNKPTLYVKTEDPSTPSVFCTVLPIMEGSMRIDDDVDTKLPRISDDAYRSQIGRAFVDIAKK